MKIPKRVKIGGRIVRISRAKKFINSDEGRGLDGFWLSEKNLIWVSPEAPNPLQTYLHEYFHACFDEIGVHQAEWSADIEEILCTKLADFALEGLK